MSEINRYGFTAGAALQNTSGYFPEGQAPSTLNDAARQVMADVRREHQCRSGELTATFSAQTYSVTFEREITSGELGGIFAFIADTTNTGTAKVNINSLGAKDLKTPYGHLQSSDIPAKSVIVCAYNKSGDYFDLVSRTVRDTVNNRARVKTGTYTGDGSTSLAITGLGFPPIYVKIVTRRTGDGAVATVMETWDVVNDNNASGGGIEYSSSGAVSFQTGYFRSLDADGFTVGDSGNDSDPNANGVNYDWIAFG